MATDYVQLAAEADARAARHRVVATTFRPGHAWAVGEELRLAAREARLAIGYRNMARSRGHLTTPLEPEPR